MQNLSAVSSLASEQRKKGGSRLLRRQHLVAAIFSIYAPTILNLSETLRVFNQSPAEGATRMPGGTTAVAASVQ